MKRLFRLLALAFVGASSAMAEEPVRPVVLDIGHQTTSSGAQSPDGKINEYAFWCRYAIEVRKVVEEAGYPCMILNRGNAPTKGKLAEYNREAGVIQLNKPDKNAKRYPSTHHPEHIGAGMICADYAIDQNACCVVFLHLNSLSGSWISTPPAGLIICNKKHGNALAESVCAAMRRNILDRPGGMPNAGKGIKVLPRFIGSQPSAGWMNTLDEEKIPAIVFEAVYLNNRNHVNFISKDENARKLARTIGEGVVDWLKVHVPLPKVEEVEAEEVEAEPVEEESQPEQTPEPAPQAA